MKKNYGAMTIDTGDFDRGMKKLMHDVDFKAIGPGLFQAGNALLKDAIYVPPQAPKEFGDLRGSARTQGPDGMLIKAGNVPQQKSVGTGSKVSIRAGFNIEYAAKWHEAVGRIINWTRDKGAANPGPKYLEMKMRMFPGRYINIVGEYIKSILKKKSPAATGGSNV
jgi:hypothetical protein